MMNKMTNKRGMNTNGSRFEPVLRIQQQYDGVVTHVNDKDLVMVSILEEKEYPRIGQLEEIEYHTIGQDIMLQHYEKGFVWGLKLVDSVQLSKNSILTLRRVELESFGEVDQIPSLEKGDSVKIFLLPFKQEHLPAGLMLTLAPNEAASAGDIVLNAEEGEKLETLIQAEIDNELSLGVEKLAPFLTGFQVRGVHYYPQLQGNSTQTTLFSKIDNVMVRTTNRIDVIYLDFFTGNDIKGLTNDNNAIHSFKPVGLGDTFWDVRREIKRARRASLALGPPPSLPVFSLSLIDKDGNMLIKQRKIENVLTIKKDDETGFIVATHNTRFFSGTGVVRLRDVSIMLARHEIIPQGDVS